MTNFMLPVQFLSLSERGSIKPSADSDVRAAWLAELDECEKRRSSLRRRMRRAQRAGERRKLADLEKQYWPLCPDPEWPHIKPTQRLVVLKSQSYGSLTGTLTEGEWDKTVPPRLRNEKGRAVLRTLSDWRRASEHEKRNLEERVRRSRDDASWALREILRRFALKDGEYFFKLFIAFEEERPSSTSFQKLKEELIAYRFSLNWSRTPGEPRHTIAEIKQIVAPGSSITTAVFRNMVRKFEVPHLTEKRGKGSPNYGLTKNGSRQ
jgi:hypothetical protein